MAKMETKKANLSGNLLIFVFSLFLIPLILILLKLYICSLEEFQKYHVYSHDPEYIYLMNGLSYLTIGKIGYIDHPGTPSIVFIGQLLKLKYILDFGFFTKQGIVKDLLDSPNKYLDFVSFSMVSLYAGLLIIFSTLIYLKTRNLLISLFFQAINLQSVIYISFLPQMTSEYFVIVVSLILSYLVLKIFLRRARARIDLILLFSLFAGVAIAVKILFLPVFVFLILISIPYYRDFVTILAFFGISLLVSIFPVIDSYKIMMDWFIGIFTHTAMYGGGENKIFDLVAMWRYLWQFVLDEKIFFFLFSFNSFRFLKTLYIYSYKPTYKTKQYLLLTGAILICVGGFLLQALKHYNGARYFIPGFHFNNALVLINCISFLPKIEERRYLRVSLALLILTIVMFRASDFFLLLKERESLYSHYTEIQKTISHFEKESRIYFAGNSYTQLGAFAFGNHYTRFGQGYFSDALTGKYGKQYVFWGGENGFSDWDYNHSQSFQEVRKSYKGKVYIIGVFKLDDSFLKHKLIANINNWNAYEILQ